MAMRRIDPSAALRKPGASRNYFGLQWRMFAVFGLSDQPLYPSLTSLSDDATALKRIMVRTQGPVILAGHAYAGAVIGAMNDERVKALVYIAALAPDEGETVARVFSNRSRSRQSALSEMWLMIFGSVVCTLHPELLFWMGSRQWSVARFWVA
jgi:pimeloyl-ACP methyl ester carboxylesterase